MPTAHAKNLVTFGSISAKNADVGTMCQSCRDLWSFHQEILNEILSLGDITGNEICRWSYPQCQISETAALKANMVLQVFSNWYVIKDLKFIFVYYSQQDKIHRISCLSCFPKCVRQKTMSSYMIMPYCSSGVMSKRFQLLHEMSHAVALKKCQTTRFYRASQGRTIHYTVPTQKLIKATV